MRPVVHQHLKSIKDSVDANIPQAFKSKQDRMCAEQLNGIMHDVLSQPPIGWNVGTTRAEYYIACHKILSQKYIQQYPGFFPEFIIMFLIKGIISWIIQQWLNDLFPKEI